MVTRNTYRLKFFFSFVFSFLILFGLNQGSFSINSLYAIGWLHAYDHDLFKGNLYMHEDVISPRYITDALIAALMRFTNGSFYDIALIFGVLAAAVLAVAIAHISYRINKAHQMFISVILTYVAFCNCYHRQLFNFFFSAFWSFAIGSPVSIALLGVSFLVGENKNYKIAWLCAACAALFHIHEGIWCSVFIFTLALADSLSQKKLLIRENSAIIVAIVALLIVAVPNLLTDSTELSSADFVHAYLYAIPSHTTLAYSGLLTNFCRLFFHISLFVFPILFFTLAGEHQRRRQHLLECGMLMILEVVLFILIYINESIKPSAFFTLMIPARMLKYILLWLHISTVRSLVIMRKRGFFFSGYLMLNFVIFSCAQEISQPRDAILLFCSAFLTFAVIAFEGRLLKNTKTFASQNVVRVLDGLFFAWCFVRIIRAVMKGTFSPMYLVLQGSVVLSVFTISLRMREIKSGKRGFFSLLTCAVCLGVTAISAYIMLDPVQHDHNKWLDEVHDLATAYKNKTNKDSVCLCEIAHDDSWLLYLQAISQRNLYVAFSGVPSCKRNMGEWYRRCMQTRDLWNKTCDEIRAIMSAEGIPYVLVPKSNYSKLDTNSDFSVFIRSPNDTLRIYELKNYANHNTNDG